MEFHRFDSQSNLYNPHPPTCLPACPAIDISTVLLHLERERMSELPFESPDGPSVEAAGASPVNQPLRGETVVFTGKLWSLGRKEARSIVDRLGGVAEDDVTLRTTVLVLGGETYPDGVPEPSRVPNEQSTHRQ